MQSPVLAPAPPQPTASPTRRRTPPVPLITTCATLPLYGIWATLLATGGGDLAAQYAWAGFAARHPGTPYALFWYAGTHTANYSVLSPPLMALLGVRTISVLSGVAATWLLSALLTRTLVRSPLWPSLLGALGVWTNVASGRTTFALGLAFGLAALLAVADRAHLKTAALAASLATLASPVAGLFLLVAAAGYGLNRRYAKSLALALPPVLLVASTTLLFPFEGEQPMSAIRLALPLLMSAVVAWAAPREWRVVRAGAGVYAIGAVLTWLIPSPVGMNVERLALHFAPTVLLAALLHTSRRRTVALSAALAVSVHWCVLPTALDLRVTTPVPAWAGHTTGVRTELTRLGATRARIEVPPARDHREAILFAPHIQQMRGWNRQLDVERGRLFYDDHLDASRYRAWLHHWAITYVVLPRAAPEPHSVAESALIPRARKWLRPVWHDADWQIYRVTDPTPLATPPAQVLRADEAVVHLKLPRAATITVRVAYSPWLRAEGACVRERAGWTELTAPRAGVYRLTSSYVRVLDGQPACRQP
ncbi:hypothetical protein AB0I98_28480 [Streptomyces sp. NPDC050211]|uniref:hypothetical protein n=1 Tax=Streptomyces sp. NPDC050211 TaxID=3154932 RepID=UPI00342F3422